MFEDAERHSDGLRAIVLVTPKPSSAQVINELHLGPHRRINIMSSEIPLLASKQKHPK
jgi:hypothetical protein